MILHGIRFPVPNFLFIVFQALEQNKSPSPPMFFSHGTDDSLVLYEWGRSTHNKLTALGVHGPFLSYDGLDHDMSTEELIKLKQWIRQMIPELIEN